MNLFDFWAKLPPGENIHPEDKPFLLANEHSFQTDHRPPGPMDGPLRSSKVVICYANSGYDELDKNHGELLRKQLTGTQLLPLHEMKHWRKWYGSRLAKLGRPLDEILNLVSIFNICPYSSVKMDDADVRVAAGLPSVWAAQKHLREELIPQALSGEIFLVIARKHQLWGISEGFNCPTIAIIRNRGGYLGHIGDDVRRWLGEKGL
jgi:hypothetical protein